ncbi:hypothetical protein [Kitasatospora sp. NPDC057015]|uniref:hypothetical protein n=1 Tax=Kitasatospora sp. NPDC057015 TaxID=3346001 RepID=UPI00363AE0A6
MFGPRSRVPAPVSVLASPLVLALVLAVSAVLFLLAGPAGAEESQGPKNAQEAAICASLLSWVLPSSPAPTSIDAICTVKGNGG